MAKATEQQHSRIGDEIEAYCGRCKIDRMHRIVAQDPDGTIRKVICGMCNSYRAYRAPSAGGTSTPRRSASSTRSQQPEDFGTPSRSYNMRENYQAGEIIAHASFGVGKVMSVRDANKIEVKFSDGLKVLLQNK